MAEAWDVLDNADATALKTDAWWLSKIDNWTTLEYPANQISKAAAEISNNSALKASFEAEEVIFDAWKWIDDGIPTLPQGQPTTYVNYLRRITTYRRQKLQGSPDDVVPYYRVQGGEDNFSAYIVQIDSNGNVSFSSATWFNFSTDNLEHANYYKNKNGEGAEIYKFDVPKWFDDLVKEHAIPQWSAPKNAFYQDGNAPYIVDVNVTDNGHAFTFHNWNEFWKTELMENLIQGSGEILP